MIDRLRNFSRAIGGLAIPSLVLAAACLAYAVFIVFTSSSHEGDKYLFPSILGFTWALSVYGFIETFKHVPEHLEGKPGLLKRTKRKLLRLWYWVIGLVFCGTSIAIIVLTFRTLPVWFGEYGAEGS